MVNECYYRDEEGALLVASSYVNEDGETVTETRIVEEG